MKNLLLIILLSITQILSAQDKKDKKEKSIKDLTKSSSTIDGLFTIFQDSSSGELKMLITCLLYTSPSPRDVEESRMPSSA